MVMVLAVYNLIQVHDIHPLKLGNLHGSPFGYVACYSWD